ncbi:sugar kinase [Streptomyces parvus]|uniref:sugar kinase n=1 Tax=Streptomyces parvus TaxID=66428 RepID=UPI00342F37C3
MTDVLTFGESMVSLRADGLIRAGGPLHTSVAGAETNVAIGLARLGHDVRWVGLTGADEFGRLVLRTLRAENVDLAHSAVSEDGPTGLVVFEPRTPDVTRVAYYRSGSAGSRLTAQHLAPALADGARVVHTTGVTAALGPGPLEAVRSALREATEQSVTTCFDVNYRAKLWSPEEAATALRPLVASVDILVASDDELSVVTPASARTERERVESLLERGVREVVVKRGAEGAEVFHPGSAARPAVPVPVRDTVGAGDAFVAGYLSAWLDGEPVGDRLARAVTTGAFAVATPGDWEGAPMRDELGLIRATPGSTLR